MAGPSVSFSLYQDHHMLLHLIELRLALISYQDYHMLLPLIELRLALISYQDDHMSCYPYRAATGPHFVPG